MTVRVWWRIVGGIVVYLMRRPTMRTHDFTAAQAFNPRNYDDADYALAHREEFPHLTAADWAECEKAVDAFWS